MMDDQTHRIIFKNEVFSPQCNIDLFVTCIGYEDRSFYIYNKIIDRLNSDNTLIFAVNDYADYPNAKKIFNEAKSRGLDCSIVQYANSEAVQKRIMKKVNSIVSKNRSAEIHIDYSSMPRGWYCKLPELLSQCILSSNKVYFWYSEGEYLKFDDGYPTVGINSYVLYSGKPSLVDRNRTHFIGVGFDSIRTNGIITLLNPESVVTCAANNPTRKSIMDKVKTVNKEIMDESYMNLSLDLTDFEFMIAKIAGIVNEIYTIAHNDIVIIPDGPKPLIFAMSMIPWLTNKPGICCLHIIRNDSIFKPNNVKAFGESSEDGDSIIGFSFANQ